jgi:hypothetical protein
MNISRWPKTDLRWYLGVACAKCETPILFALDHSEGEEERRSPPPETLVLTCHSANCRHKADYTSAAVRRFQKETGATKESSAV